MSSQASLDDDSQWRQDNSQGEAQTHLDRADEGAKYSRAGNGPNRSDHQPARDSTKCQGCGTPISERRRRQLGDNDDIVWHCLDCQGVQKSDLSNGAGAMPDYPIGEDTAVGDYETSEQAKDAVVATVRGGRR